MREKTFKVKAADGPLTVYGDGEPCAIAEGESKTFPRRTVEQALARAEEIRRGDTPNG